MPNRKNKYKDTNKFRETQYHQRLRYYRQFQNVPNKGKLWTEEEISIVLAHEIPDREISKLIGRSVQAIQICRTRKQK